MSKHWGGGQRSGISVLIARHDDDIYIYIYMYIHRVIYLYCYIYIKKTGDLSQG